MILTCPSCDTHYKLDMAALRPEGQAVRCFKCKHEWTQDPSELEDDAPVEDAGEDIGEDIDEDIGEDIGEDIDEDISEDVDDDDDPIDLENFEPRPVDRETGKPIVTKPPSKIAKVAGWLLFFIIFGGGVTGAIIYRDMVREVWPVSNRLYTLIGLGVEAPGTGFELRNVQSKRSKKDGAPSLVISGEIANISRKVRVVPIFSGELTNSAGDPLHEWTFTVRQKNLLPGESVPFKTEVDNLPKGAVGLNITFLDPEPVMEEGEAMEEDADAVEDETDEEMAEEDAADEMMEDEMHSEETMEDHMSPEESSEE